MKMPLQAPCIFCGYNGQGYWQSETHNEHCPLRHIGGEADREEFLRELFGSHRDCIARIAALEAKCERMAKCIEAAGKVISAADGPGVIRAADQSEELASRYAEYVKARAAVEEGSR